MHDPASYDGGAKQNATTHRAGNEAAAVGTMVGAAGERRKVAREFTRPHVFVNPPVGLPSRLFLPTRNFLLLINWSMIHNVPKLVPRNMLRQVLFPSLGERESLSVLSGYSCKHGESSKLRSIIGLLLCFCSALQNLPAEERLRIPYYNPPAAEVAAVAGSAVIGWSNLSRSAFPSRPSTSPSPAGNGGEGGCVLPSMIRLAGASMRSGRGAAAAGVAAASARARGVLCGCTRMKKVPRCSNLGLSISLVCTGH